MAIANNAHQIRMLMDYHKDYIDDHECVKRGLRGTNYIHEDAGFDLQV